MDLVLQLGAHRTASSLVQYALADAAERTGAPVEVWLPCRSWSYKMILHRPDRWQSRLAWYRQRLLNARRNLHTRRQLRSDFAVASARGTQKLVFCDENLIGVMSMNLRHGFYTMLGERMKILRRIFPQPAVLSIGIRDYATFWSSSYFYIREKGQDVPSAQEVSARVLAQPGRWESIVETLRGIWPKSEIAIWQIEAMPSALASVCEKISGIPAAEFGPPPARVNAREARSGGGDLFTPHQSGELRRHYNRSVEILAARDDLIWSHAPVYLDE